MNIIESINKREEETFRVGDLVKLIDTTPKIGNVYWYRNQNFANLECIITEVDDLKKCRGKCFTCYGKETSNKQYIEARPVKGRNYLLSSCNFVFEKIKPKDLTKEYSKNIYINRRNK